MPGLILSNRKLALPETGLLPHMRIEKISLEQIGDLELYGSTYQNYPLRSFVFQDTTVLLEGFIYDLNNESIDRQLIEILQQSDGTEENLANWIAQRDGEFILMIFYPNQNKVLVFNDQFGRLPLYYHCENSKFVVSREISVLLDTVQPKKDDLSVASNLLFGFAIGNRTVHEGVKTLPNHSSLKIDLNQCSVLLTTFSDPAELLKTKDATISPEQLKEELSSALKRRIEVCGPCGLALSGGLDSRIIVGLLEEAGIKIPMFTYSRTKDGNDADVTYAKQVSERLKLGALHETIDLSDVDPGQIVDLQRIKRGQNFLAMAYILPFLDVFRERGLCQITGDGGDKTLESIYPLRKLNSEKDLLNYIFKKHAQMPVVKAAEQSGVEASFILKHLSNILNANQTLTFDERYAAFILKERGMNWLFEGEDRNRYYTWSTTPFYAPNFVKQSLAVPVVEKQYGRLFTALLSSLPGKTENILNPNWGLAPNDTAAVKKLFQRQKLKTMIPSFLLKLVRK
jgi:asparagine synthase (glutamine-hydrolysing)